MEDDVMQRSILLLDLKDWRYELKKEEDDVTQRVMAKNNAKDLLLGLRGCHIMKCHNLRL
eukprot:1159449-Pelagomonas_calceolata.AAC.2